MVELHYSLPHRARAMVHNAGNTDEGAAMHYHVIPLPFPSRGHIRAGYYERKTRKTRTVTLVCGWREGREAPPSVERSARFGAAQTTADAGVGVGPLARGPSSLGGGMAHIPIQSASRKRGQHEWRVISCTRRRRPLLADASAASDACPLDRALGRGQHIR